MSDSQQNSGNDDFEPIDMVSVDEAWIRFSPDTRENFGIAPDFTARLRAPETTSQIGSRGTTRRREDATESPRPRQVARTASTSPSPARHEATPSDDADRNDLVERNNFLEDSNAAYQAENNVLREQIEDAETENRRFLERIQALEVENLALKQKVRRLERQRD
ncbi:hypothetical protein NW762_011195 [Fusarium torreyae]|uniref:Uncharacterized protein n=1 Tax=Fusarium torreyae TaxID=1237075 RepID=A0A9W8RU01_9HYPO|nr:hypothetical protein NW762_011195 [Fusarium torreyae]